ncbi:hypothetical protein PVK06_016291 [Gossypium arboreum]|uniref:CCHC-type domain-containing protein n=1 Tax=Gossypium arboreum TaxID=29729 RepID=A0ABR0Q0C2_GOSAR|nr:hypothetical protein PVK06_016291 [Gossypium arboreum]
MNDDESLLDDRTRAGEDSATKKCRIDFDAVLTQGLWIVFGHYLIVQSWTVNFDSSRPFPCGVLAWIRFPDLEKPLISQDLINTRLQRVEFEALPEVCFSCGKYGHSKNSCPSYLAGGNGHDGEGDPTSSLLSETASVRTEDTPPMMGDAFGPWMVVERKSRGKHDVFRGQKSKVINGILGNSRFDALSSIDSEPLMPDLEASTKDIRMARFSQGGFIRKLKGKYMGLESGPMAEENRGESLLDPIEDVGPCLKSRPLKKFDAKQTLEVEARVSTRATDQTPNRAEPSSALGPMLSGQVFVTGGLGLNPTLGLPHK